MLNKILSSVRSVCQKTSVRPTHSTILPHLKGYKINMFQCVSDRVCQTEGDTLELAEIIRCFSVCQCVIYIYASVSDTLANYRGFSLLVEGRRC
jgi:hypothetical protein